MFDQALMSKCLLFLTCLPHLHFPIFSPQNALVYDEAQASANNIKYPFFSKQTCNLAQALCTQFRYFCVFFHVYMNVVFYAIKGFIRWARDIASTFSENMAVKSIAIKIHCEVLFHLFTSLQLTPTYILAMQNYTEVSRLPTAAVEISSKSLLLRSSRRSWWWWKLWLAIWLVWLCHATFQLSLLSHCFSSFFLF